MAGRRGMGEVWRATPLKDDPPHVPRGREIHYKPSVKRIGRPALVVSESADPDIVHSLRHVVLPIKTREEGGSVPPHSIAANRGKYRTLDGYIVACQPLGLSPRALPAYQDEVKEQIHEAHMALDGFLMGTGGMYSAGDMVRVEFEIPVWCVVASGAWTPLGLVTVFRSIPDLNNNLRQHHDFVFIHTNEICWENDGGGATMPPNGAAGRIGSGAG